MADEDGELFYSGGGGGEGDEGELSADSLAGGQEQGDGGGGGEGAGEGAGEEGAEAGEGGEGGQGGAPAGQPRRAGFDAASEDVLLSLPAFANAANRALHERLLKLNRQLARATADTRENQERAGVMQEHLKHIRAELASAQRVAESKAKELRTEEHLAAMAERALGRSRQDVTQHDGRLAEVRSQTAALQAQIDKGTERLEAFRSSMNWKKEELERWTAAARQREEDVRALDECVL